MDPRDRLWHELVFTRCKVATLLALRAVCRAFRAQLDRSRLWLPHTLAMAQLRHDERLAGWHGIERAIAREAATRGNCDAGRCGLGPVLEFQQPWEAQELLVVAGHIVAFCTTSIKVFAVDSGAGVASFAVAHPSPAAHQALVVADRWVPFCTRDNRALVLDCLTLQLVDMASPHRHQRSILSVAGMRVAHRLAAAANADVVVVVVQLAQGSGAVSEVARLPVAETAFALCEGGLSYLRFDEHNSTLRLLDVATQRAKRVICLSECCFRQTQRQRQRQRSICSLWLTY